MAGYALDIGLEIKILRERLKVSSKDLAQKVGLSQSQMSRLEKGQRRIDIRILQKISEALGVEPSFFLRSADSAAPAATGTDAEPPPSPIAPVIKYDKLGTLVRSERRRKHLTVDDLAAKVGRTKAYMVAFEEGRHALDAELAEKICKVLRLPANFFVQAQQDVVKALEAQVSRLNQALAEAHRGREDASGEGENAGDRRRPVPLFSSLATGSGLFFDAEGQPVGEPESFIAVPGFVENGAFALTVVGDAMESGGHPSFHEGDIVVFTSTRQPRSRELALVRLSDDSTQFRQVFFESDGSVRLQPLNLQHAPKTCPRHEVLGLFGLALHIARV